MKHLVFSSAMLEHFAKTSFRQYLIEKILDKKCTSVGNRKNKMIKLASLLKTWNKESCTIER